MPDSDHTNTNLMNNRVVVVTGANRGIGRVIATELSAMGACVIMACRSVKHARLVRQEILAQAPDLKLEVMELDLADMDSVRHFASDFNNSYQQLDVLVNNAGVQMPVRELNRNGVEMTFAINVLGHHLLTKMLQEALRHAPDARIVNIASDFAGGLDLDDINLERRKFDIVSAYKQSKQANRMMTREWARRLADDGITVNSMTPDLIAETDLFRHQNAFLRLIIRMAGVFVGGTVKEGADTAVWMASDPALKDVTGAFFRKREQVHCRFEDKEAEERLWSVCEDMLNNDREKKTDMTGEVDSTFRTAEENQ